MQALAVSKRHVVTVVKRGRSVRMEAYDPLSGRLQRSIRLPGGVESSTSVVWGGTNDDLSTSGDYAAALHGTHDIWVVDLRTGMRTTVSRTRGAVVGASLAGRRLVWGENAGGGSRILELTLP